MQLIEHYLSIQGEGLHSGRLTYFVRFARCNLRCTWCDSTYTFGDGQAVEEAALKEAIRQSGVEFVCLTGGEPLLHVPDCQKLMSLFSDLHFDIETGGSLDIEPVQKPNSSVIMDWKLARSGMSGKMKKENLLLLRPQSDLLKFVTDGSPEETKEILALLEETQKQGFPVAVQPIFGEDPRKLTEWLLSLKNKRLRISLQIHKHIWPSMQAGV